MKFISQTFRILYQICLKITVMCSINLTTLMLKIWKSMGGNPVGIKSFSRWIICVTISCFLAS